MHIHRFSGKTLSYRRTVAMAKRSKVNLKLNPLT